MYIFLGIAVLAAVGVVVHKTMKAAKQPVNGEMVTLSKLDRRIHTVGLIIHSHLPHV